MTTSTRTAREADAPTPARPRRLGVRALVVVAVLVAATVGLLLGLRAARPGVLPNVVLDDVAVGGLDESELRLAVQAYEQRRRDEDVTVTRPAVTGRPGSAESLESSAGEVGYTLAVEDTVDGIWRRGRQANPLAALADHLRAFTDTFRVEPAAAVDEDTLDLWADQTAAALALPAVDGDVRIDGAAVTRVDPAPGARIDGDELRADARAAALEPGPSTVEAEFAVIEPARSAEAVEAAFTAASVAVSGPLTLQRGDASVTFSAEQIGGALRVVPLPGGGLGLEADPEAVTAVVGDPSVFATEPVNASFRIDGETVSVVPGADGFRYDPAAAAAQLREVAASYGPRQVQLAGTLIEPERTTQEAQALNITQQVSEFTTNHACCQNRVTNIHRIADIVDGVVIAPGESFSVNDYVGRRTRAKGFVADGAISGGEFIEAVGGGVSQFATTMFNAAYFGGYEIIEYKPHSQYISRYPVGREATLNYPNVDLEILNNSPHGILVDTSYTGTSITVTFYGTPWVEVDSITGERRNFTGPETIVRRTDELPAGQQRVVQTGEGQGFDITVTRILRYPDGREEREQYYTHYVARPRIVEVGV